MTIARPRPLDVEVPAWDLHVSLAKAPARGLCGCFVLSNCDPPRAVELGRARPDGSTIEIGELELEAGWIATVVRHPEAGRVGALCAACLTKIERLRSNTRARRAAPRARPTRAAMTRTIAASALREFLRTRTRVRATTATWLEDIAARFGDE